MPRARASWTCVALLLLFSAPVCAAPSSEPSAEPAEASDTPAKAVDRLYARLAVTRNPDEAEGIIGEIDRALLVSGSDTADLLMRRALDSRTSKPELALSLFDAVIDLRPEWSEAWSERATARYAAGDVPGAMSDIGQTLKREPRDIGALAGLGAILTQAGRPDEALRAYDAALKLAPAYQTLVEARARAKNALQSQSP